MTEKQKTRLDEAPAHEAAQRIFTRIIERFPDAKKDHRLLPILERLESIIREQDVKPIEVFMEKHPSIIQRLATVREGDVNALGGDEQSIDAVNKLASILGRTFSETIHVLFDLITLPIRVPAEYLIMEKSPLGILIKFSVTVLAGIGGGGSSYLKERTLREYARNDMRDIVDRKDTIVRDVKSGVQTVLSKRKKK